MQGSDGEKVKRKPGGGFQKPFLLSGALSQVCGETQVCLSGAVNPCGDNQWPRLCCGLI